MKFLKNFLAFVFIAGVFGYVGYNYYRYYLGQCGQVLEYSIGRFDSEFGLTENNFKKYVEEAEKPWEKILGKELFVYNSEAKFKVNLIYDERQQTTEAKQKTEFGLSAVEERFKDLDAQFVSMKASYDGRVASYQEALKSFENRQEAYEQKVKFWNAKNGAPKNEYEALQREQADLNREASRLNAETSSINTLTKELNALLERRNEVASEYNQTAKSYSQKYGHGLEFNQAEYTRGDINVYQFSNKNDLILALSHEFGHSLGMDHVENPKSIMYYVTGVTNTAPVPSEEDLAEFKRVCKL